MPDSQTLPHGHRYFIGVMSGTSLDAVDAVVLQTGATGLATVAHTQLPIDEPLKQALLCLSGAGPVPIAAPDATSIAAPVAALTPQPGQASGPASAAGMTDTVHDAIELLGTTRRLISELYASTVLRLPAKLVAQAQAIGAHGQTIRHRPERGYTLQILDGALLSGRTGLPVVNDLRSADVAAGGQGAPLVPAFHAALFAGANNPDKSNLAVVNIGGIANVSVIGGHARVIAGFDTGPGNRLMDDWCREHQHKPYDNKGQWAASGNVNPALLAQLLSDEFFARALPKSTGREHFNVAWLRRNLRLANASDLQPQDVQATLTELTARTIADALVPFAAKRLLVCGGGALNAHLMQRLSVLVQGRCESTAEAGMDPQQVEAAAFAWLAMQRIDEVPTLLASSTGARHDNILGALHLPPATS